MEALQRLHNRGSISTGYDIDNSLKLEDDNSEGLTKNYSGDGDRRTWTYSTWIKRTELSQDYYCLFFAGYTGIQLMSENYLRVELYDGTTTRYADTNQLFRDTSAWYHIVVTLDSTDSTASDRVKIWINGSRVTDFGTSTYASMSQNDQFGIGQASSNYQFGHWFAGGANDRRFCGYVAETHYVNGTALEATDFGEYDSDSGIWIPKEYTGSHGSKGFYLKFDDSSNLGKDSSSGGIGDFTLSNITSADQATDTPTNNFATQNVIWGTDRIPLMSEGATEIGNNVNAYRWSPATMGVANGKWYWEIKPTVNGNTLVSGAGIASNQETLAFYQTTGNFVYHYDGNRYVNGGSTGYGAAWATNDIIGFAYDADNWTLTCYVNNSSQGNLLASQADLSGELFIPYVYSFGTHTYQINFGGYTTMSNTHTNTDENGYGSFVYAPPSGYYALCTKNLEEFG
jgi:hypothetical protein